MVSSRKSLHTWITCGCAAKSCSGCVPVSAIAFIPARSAASMPSGASSNTTHCSGAADVKRGKPEPDIFLEAARRNAVAMKAKHPELFMQSSDK